MKNNRFALAFFKLLVYLKCKQIMILNEGVPTCGWCAFFVISNTTQLVQENQGYEKGKWI